VMAPLKDQTCPGSPWSMQQGCRATRSRVARLFYVHIEAPDHFGEIDE
jgi:hypothetical protein